MKTAMTLRTFRRSDTRQIVHPDKLIEGEDSYIEELCRNGMAREIAAFTRAPENKAAFGHRSETRMIVTATQSINEGGIRAKRGDTLNLVSATAKELQARGLVSFNGLSDANPRAATGAEPSSASPVVQASPQPTASSSDDGEPEEKKPRKTRKKKAEESS